MTITLVYKAKYKMIRLLFSLLTIFLFIESPSQSKIDTNKRKLFYQQYNEKSYNSVKLLGRAKNMFKYAQNDYEKALAYFSLGEDVYDQGNFLESVSLLQKADSLIKKNGSLDVRLEILFTLTISYRRAGLIVESDETLRLIKELGKELNLYDRTGKLNLLFIQTKIYDIDGKYCKAADIRQRFIQDANIASNNSKNRFAFSILVQLCYEQIKCGRIEAAKETLGKVENILNTKSAPILCYELYFLNKALLNIKDNNRSEARKNFDLAYSQPNISPIVIKQILLDRLEANIDTPTDQLKFSKIVLNITNSQITLTKDLAVKETIKDKNRIKETEGKFKLSIIIFILITVVLIIAATYIFRIKNKRIKSRYQKIIQELKNPPAKTIVFAEFRANDSSKEKNSISEETEREILKRLDTFEKKRLYTTKGISAAQMSVMLKTNTKYLYYIIKKYKNSDFYNYINTQRIDYIVKELHDNPHLLQYKISALADMCGYNSHSQFGSIFKSIKNISPSQYISFLREEQKNKP